MSRSGAARSDREVTAGRQGEAPRPGSPLAGVRDADPCGGGDLPDGHPRTALDPERAVTLVSQIDGVQASVDPQRPAEPSWPVRSGFDALARLEGPHQDRRAHAFSIRDRVETEVHTVDKVDVGVPSWPEHDAGPRRPAPRSE